MLLALLIYEANALLPAGATSTGTFLTDPFHPVLPLFASISVNFPTRWNGRQS